MKKPDKSIDAIIKKENLKAFFNIKRTASYLDQCVNDFLKPYNITEQQYNILRILRGAGQEITVKTVKERMIQKSPNATRLMDKLFDKQWIERRRCENDRRVVYVNISVKGLKLLDKIDFRKFDNNIQKLSAQEAKILNEILIKIFKD